MICHLDYETRSCVPLDERGLDNYVHDPSTEVILAAYAFDDHAVKLWQPHLGPMPDDLRDALESPFVTVYSWNAQFERAITKHVLGIDKPIEEWRDPMIMARYTSLPGSLEDAGEILGLGDDLKKIKDGKRLIRKFCVPENEGGQVSLLGVSEPTFRDWNTDPEDWARFCSYCRGDVVSERAIWKKLRKLSPPEHEWETWFLSERICERGIPVDLDLIRGAQHICNLELDRLKARLIDLTGLDNPNSNSQMLEWLSEQGYPFSSLGKAFVKRAMEGGEGNLTDLAREVLEIRKMTSKSSVKKFEAIGNIVGKDGRLRYQFNFYGAKKTGRFSSKEAQLQNLSKPTKEVEDRLDRAIELVREMDYDTVAREFTQPLDVVSGVVRASFRAPDEQEFVVADLASIETRVIGWLSKCEAILDIYRQGKDAYKMFACKMFNKPYDEITKDERQKAKAPVLGCFGANTPVLTQRGWVSIEHIRLDDRLWDGQEWVDHGGTISQGVKEVVDLFGVEATPDHQILIGDDWKPVCEVIQNGRLEKLAIDLATGLLPDLLKNAQADTPTHASALGVDKKRRCTETTSKRGRPSPAPPVQTAESSKRKEVSTLTSPIIQGTSSTVWQTGTTQSSLDAEEREKPLTDTRAEGSSAGLSPSTISLGTVLLSPASTTPKTTLIEQTTTVTTSEATSGSFRTSRTTATRSAFATLSGTESGCAPRSSGRDSAQNTESQEPLSGSSGRVSAPSRSLQSRQTVVVPTFDILNAGPRNRFVILSNRGPLIVHNCGFGLGGGQEKEVDGDIVKTGLWGYAWAMGVELTQDESHQYTKIYRQEYREVVQFWYDLHDSAVSAIRNPGQEFEVGYLKLRCIGKSVLCLILPNGRTLHYLRPQIEKRVYNDRERNVVTYETEDQKTKTWGRADLAGYQICENAVQAVARDFLISGMKEATAAGFDIVLHVHDEIGALVRRDGRLCLEGLKDCMTRRPYWTDDKITLEADGYKGTYYKK